MRNKLEGIAIVASTQYEIYQYVNQHKVLLT